MFYKSLSLFIIILAQGLSYASTTSTAPQPEATPTATLKPSLKFINPWARPSMTKANQASNSAVYLAIKNDSDTSYKLINVSSDAANKVELHQTFTDEKGISKMVKVDNLVIPSKGEVELKPGGAHIMLFDLRQILNEGDKFKVNFYFDDSSRQAVEVKVSSSAPQA